MKDRISEIQGYFKHGDLDLARRRLLDMIYDSGQTSLIRESIAWSRSFTQDRIDGEMWIETGSRLTDKLSQINTEISVEKNRLFQSSNITKTYRNGFFTLSGIDLSVNSGEILGVVGENGNGKTTLLRSIAGYLDAGLTAGNYHYLSKESGFYYSLKNSTGFIPQRIPKWYGPLRDNLLFSAAIHNIRGKENDLMVDFILERFNLTKFSGLTWAQISSGYRTRFEIARLILQRPALLILDEPLANLDIIAQQTLLQDLRFIARSDRHPMGIILTSQQLFEVEKVADRVLFIQAGKGRYNEIASADSIGVFEIETESSRDLIENSINDLVESIKFNGGIYEIRTTKQCEKCLHKLLSDGVKIRYYRDISQSTKRYF